MHERTPPTPLPAPRVADLHCDLLAYLAAGPNRSADHPASRCSVPQLRSGHVGLQTLAIFTLTNDDAIRFGAAQTQAFRNLVTDQAEEVVAIADHLDALDRDGTAGDDRIGVVAAIENASGFCDESEPLDRGLERLCEIERTVGGLLYVSLTWNQANRFGGGCASEDIGLRDDGRVLLDFLAARGIALDFSHASARLADDMLEYLEAKGLDLAVCASHSCFLAKNSVPRNIPDDIARGIAARGGVIGLNFLRVFLSQEESVCRAFAVQIEHAAEISVGHAYGLGADFFCADDVPIDLRSAMPTEYFFPQAANAGCYPSLLAELGTALSWDDSQLDAFAHGNVEHFVRRVLAARNRGC